MSKKKESTVGGGIGFGSALFLVFLVLKLTDTIDWSWWWVSAPLWAPLALVLAIIIMVAGGYSLKAIWIFMFRRV